MRFSSKTFGGIRRKLVFALGGLVVGLLVLPYVAAPFVRGKVVSQLEENLDARVSLEELSFGLSGSLHVGGFGLQAEDGRPIASAERVDGKIGLLGVIFGNFNVELELENFELHLWKNEDETWNVAGLGGDVEDKEDDGDKSSDSSNDPLPSLRAKLAAEGGRVVFHGPDGDTSLALRMSADLQSWDQPAPFELNVDVTGPNGPGGNLHASGHFALADRGRRGARGASGVFDLAIEGLQGAALEPAVLLGAPLEKFAGLINGKVSLELREDLVLNGDLDLLAESVVVRPTDARADVTIPSASLKGKATADASGAGAQELVLETGGILDASYKGTLASDGDQRIVDGKLALTGKLDGLSEIGRAFVEMREGMGLQGAVQLDFDLHSSLDENTSPSLVELTGDITTTGLQALDASGKPLPLDALEGANVNLDLSADFASGSLDLRKLTAKAGALDLNGSAKLSGVPGLAEEDAVLSIASSNWDVRADLGALRRDLATFLPPGNGKIEGRLAAHLEATGGADGPIRSRGEATLEELAIDWPMEDKKVLFSEPRIDLTFDAEVTSGESTSVAGKLELISKLMRGEVLGGIKMSGTEEAPSYDFEEVTGTFTYVPERLAKLAEPWLPGKLTGSEPEKLEFRIDGPAKGFAPEQLFKETVADATIGVGSLNMEGLELGGDLVVTIKDGKSQLNGQLLANGGSLEIGGGLGLTEESKVTPEIHFSAAGVNANSELSPLLGRLHPAFAAADAVSGSQIGGLITSQIELSHSKPLSLADLTSGDMNALMKGINGKGSFSMTKAHLQGSPLMGQLLGELGLDVGKGLDLEPIEFKVEEGRVSYVKPWQWTIEDTKTSFTGSIGLDQSLAMGWSIPISASIVEKHKFLSSLEGDMIEIPIGGTLTSPKLQLSGLLSGLASKAAGNELKKALGGGGEDGETPEQLLADADRLWQEGKKVEAAALYEKIRTDHKVSLVYAMNRDKIKKRAKYEPEGEGDSR